jgi:AcrR family transcriptional regulator
LLDAGFALFSTEGYARTTMERIARKAGASTKTLYSRYDNKAEVLGAVAERIISQSLAQHVAETAVDPADVEPRRFLASFGREVIARATGEGLGLNRLVCAEGHRYPEVGKFIAREIEPGVSRIQVALEKWRAAGLLPSLGDSRMSAILLFTMMVDRPRLRAIAGDPVSRKELDAHVDAAVDLFLRACGYASEPSRHHGVGAEEPAPSG